MAQNGRPVAEARDGSSSEEEEEEEGSSEENEEEEESESEEKEVKTSTTPVPKKPSSAPKKPGTAQTSATHPQSSSEDDSGSESDSESDSPPTNTRRADLNIKPIASKPMEEPPKATKKPRSKPASATPAAKSGTTAQKRPVGSENNSNQESKRAKKKAVDADGGVLEDTAKKTGDDSKKQLFQRLWSEEDEIAILKGMIEYTAKKGADPVADMNAFHDFIKKSLHVDVSKTQLSEKVRRLKKKYVNNRSKGKMGEDRTFSKAHEQKAYELSKKIWFGEANAVGVDNRKVNGKTRKNQNQNQRANAASPKIDGLASPDRAKEGTKIEVESSAGVSRSVGFNRSIGQSSLVEETIKDGLELISSPKKLELEEKWKKLGVEEVELYLKRTELICEQTKLVLEALKSSGH